MATGEVKVSDLGVLSSVPDNAMIMVAHDGGSYRASKKNLLKGLMPNGLVVSAGYTVVGDKVIFNKAYQWRISGDMYGNDAADEITIPAAATGMERIDLVVGNSSGDFERVPGGESADNPFAPEVPVDKALITFVKVNDAEIVTVDPVSPGDLYVPKGEQRISMINAATSLSVITNFPINDRCNFTLREFGGFKITEVKGFQFGPSFDKRPGQMFTFRNNQGVDVLFRNESADPVYKFYLTPEADFVVKPRETIVFRLDATMTKMEQVIAGAGGGDDGEYFPMTGNVYEDPVTGSVNTLADFNGTYLSINSDRYPRWTMTEGSQVLSQASNQGITSDGIHYYISENYKITKRLISDNSIVATMNNPGGTAKMGGVFWDENEGHLLTVGGVYDAPYEAYVYVINSSLSAVINTFNVTDYVDFGINAICLVLHPLSSERILCIGESGPTFGMKRWYSFPYYGGEIIPSNATPIFSSVNNFQDATVADNRIYATDHQGGVNVLEMTEDGMLNQLAYYFTGNLTALEGIDYKSGTTFRLWRILTGFTGFIEMELTETLASKLPTRIIFHRGHALIGTSSYDQAKGIVQINGRASVAGVPEHSTDVIRKTEFDALSVIVTGKQNSLGYTAENSANKATTMTGNTASNVVYLTAKAVYDWAVGLFAPLDSPVFTGNPTVPVGIVSADNASSSRYFRTNGTIALFGADVRGTALAGLPTASTAPVTASSTVLDAIGQLNAAMPRQLKDFFTDVSNVGTTETDLYSHSITAANGLTANGQKYEAHFEGVFTATSKIEFRAYYGGVKIFENLNPGTFAGAVGTSWEISIRIIRTGTTTARAYVSVKCAKPGPAFNEMGSKQTDLTGLNFTATNILKITGAADGASGDITAKMGNIVWHPAAV